MDGVSGVHTQTADLNSIETRSSLIVSLVGTISNGVCLLFSTLGSIKTKILFLNKQEVWSNQINTGLSLIDRESSLIITAFHYKVSQSVIVTGTSWDMYPLERQRERGNLWNTGMPVGDLLAGFKLTYLQYNNNIISSIVATVAADV